MRIQLDYKSLFGFSSWEEKSVNWHQRTAWGLRCSAHRRVLDHGDANPGTEDAVADRVDQHMRRVGVWLALKPTPQSPESRSPTMNAASAKAV